jgi:hypothetical protein
MGAEQPKPKRKMDKIELQIVCDKVYQYLMIHRGRKIDELALKERDVKEKLQNQKKLYGDCLFDISSIVTLLNWIMASKIIMRNVQFLKDRSMQIVSAANERNSEKIAPMIKYIQSVIWASERLNLKQIKEFTYMIQMFFGKEFIRLALQGDTIDKELADCFKFVEPTKKQVADYLRNMIRRYNFTQIDLDKELPSSYQEPKPKPAPCPPQNQGHYPPPPPNNGDYKFDYNNPSNQGGGYFDNPNHMAGRSNWGQYMNPQMHGNNLNINPNDLGKLAPSRIDDPAFSNPPNLGPQKQSLPENDFDKMINDLEGGSLVKDGNELVNPSMSQMKLGSKTKPSPPPKDDFDDLINSLQGNVVADLQGQNFPPPAMRGPPKRRNKATKPISNEPEAYMYTDEVDQDTEEKQYDELSLEYRLEQMRKLKI